MTRRFGFLGAWSACGFLAWASPLTLAHAQAIRPQKEGVAPSESPVKGRSGVPIIFDTDMGNDVDDALALAMLHEFERRGACHVLAVTLTKSHPKAAEYVLGFNDFYGRPEIPVGLVKDGATRDLGKFIGLADDRRFFPRDPAEILKGKEIPEAVSLLRKTLSAAEDHSVVVVQVGFFTNLARLLQTGPDEHSALNGVDLVAKKVKKLAVMAGAFQPIGDKTRYLEYNVVQDIPSARALAASWPTPIVWSGFEIGIALPYPHQSILKDYEWAAHHPVKESYIRYSPPPHDRPTWDLTSVLEAVLPDRGYFQLSPQGRIEVAEDGATLFQAQEGGRDQYLILEDSQKPRILEALVQLSSAPPRP